MKTASDSRVVQTILSTITIFSFSLPAYAQYSGGSGTADDPYQIATAADLMLLGEIPEDYDKHFILTADIDLDPNLPGRRVFDRAVIAPETNDSTGELDDPFTGVFDGNNHTISHLTIKGESYLGLFGKLGSRGNISNLGLEAVDVEGTRSYVGGLAGSNIGTITSSYCTGTVTGQHNVGGLVGRTDHRGRGAILANCYSSGTVSGSDRVGGLVGNNRGSITTCCSTGTVTGDEEVGGLVGYNYYSSSIALSYSTGAVTGNKMVGGLVGCINGGSITASYSTGAVTGNDVGGLVGANWSDSSISLSFWDRETSGQSTSGGGQGLSTRAMQNVDTYLREGWDFVDEILNGTSDYWQISPGDYPQLRWQGSGNIQMPEGLGTAEQPYLIRDARDMGTVWFKPLAHYRLETSLDLSGAMWSTAVIPWFGGTFDGNGHMISNLHVEGAGKLGLFGQTGSGARISYLGLEAVDVNGARDPVGGLAGSNRGTITSSYCTGTVTGGEGGRIGGLIGENRGRITTSYSIGSVRVKDTADYYGGIGGLVGFNYGSITLSYSSGVVTGSASVVGGDCSVGGLIGYDDTGIVTASYSTATVTGNHAGGLVGFCEGGTSITASYSAGAVTGGGAGGLVGLSEQPDMISSSFWDMETSGQTTSGGGTGLTTLEMQDIKTYLSERWDFESEIENGTCDYWRISPGEYPRLRYQSSENLQMPEGLGTAEQPYLIRDARDLGTVWFRPLSHYRLETSLDLSGIKWAIAVVPWFEGTFNGNGHVISNLHIQGSSYLGLFGQLGIGAKISNLGLEAVNVEGTDAHIGGLAGYNDGHITRSFSTGAVTGQGQTGGLVGDNGGSITTGHSSATVTGRWSAGGLVGHNYGLISTNSYSSGTVTSEGSAGGLVGLNNGRITTSYSTGAVDGEGDVGGLVGRNQESIATCYSTGSVSGDSDVGGLVGSNGESITSCYSTGMVNGNLRVGGLVGISGGSITASYSTGTVNGNVSVAGLVGFNNDRSSIANSYSRGTVTGNEQVGGLVGFNGRFGSIAYSYSTGTVTGNTAVGGLIGDDEDDGRIISCFWDIETSGQTTSQGGTGLNTAQMQMTTTFLDAGWDFVDETENGTDDIWWILEGQGYPRLWWELIRED